MFIQTLKESFKQTMKESFDFKEVELYLEKSSSSLVAFSIFVAILISILDSNYFNITESTSKIIYFLLYVIIVFLSVFICFQSQNYKNILIKIMGVVILVFAFAFGSILNEPIKSGLNEGGNVVLFLVFIFLTIITINAIVLNIYHIYFKNNKVLAIVFIILGVLIIILIRTTNILKSVLSINNFIHLFELPALIQVALIGIEAGVFIGIIMSLILVGISRFLPKQPKSDIVSKKVTT